MDDRDNLEASVRELTATLEELQSELRDPPARTGPLGLPRPPSPGELLRFTEQYTIPALISLLEANVRLLELLAAALRVADGRPLEATEELTDAGGRLEAVRAEGEGLAAASRATLQRLDEALAELQTAAEGGTPDDPDVRRLLSQARELRSEVDERLAEAESAPASTDEGAVRVDVDGPGSDDPDDGEEASTGVDLDVDEELDTIRRQVDGPDEPDEPDDDG